LGPFFKNLADMGLAAAIIGETELPMGICLVQDGTNAIIEIMFLDIVHGNNKGNQRFLG
jgi:hypothetical protein